MAPFNPDVKDVKPINPIGWSKSAEVPSQFASTISAGLESAGKLIGISSEAGDKLVKQNAENTAESLFRPVVDDEAAKLSGIDFSMRLGATSNAASADTTGLKPNATTSEPVEMPSTLKKLPETLGVLEGARANGHLSETAYYGRLMSMAKDLRSQYPVGYRDYIDQQISKITGVDPANAYMKSILGDINANIGNQQAERNKILARLVEHNGLSADAPKVYDALSQGRITNRMALEFLQPLEATKVKHDQRMQVYAEAEKGSQEAQRIAETSFRTYGSDLVASTIRGDMKLKGYTPDQIRDIQTKYYAGELELDNPTKIALAEQNKVHMEHAVRELQKELNLVQPDPNKEGYRPVPLSATLKDQGAKIIEEAIKPLQDIQNNFMNGDLGMVGLTQKLTEGMKQDDAHVFFKTPEYRAAAAQLSWAKDNGGGELVAKIWESLLGKGLPVQGSASQVSLLVKLSNLASAPDPRGNKEVKTLAEFIDKTTQEVKDTRVSSPTNFAEVQSLIDGKTGVSLLNPETKPQTKAAIINNFFGPGNLGVLQKIKPDYKDERGNPIPGQESWFKRFTNPEVVAEVNRVGGTAKDNYTAWVKQTYEELTLQNINKLKTMNITGAYEVQWNSATSQFIFVDKTKGPTDPNAPAGYRLPANAQNPVRDTVDALNKSIGGLRNVYRGASNLVDEDIQAKVLETLKFDEKRFGMISGLPERLLTSIQAEQKRIMEEKAAAEAKAKETRAKY